MKHIRLNRLLADVTQANPFYQHKLASSRVRLDSLEQLSSLPLTTKQELQPASAADPFAANRTFPIEAYVRCHQTSGTQGRPLTVLDTADDWEQLENYIAHHTDAQFSHGICPPCAAELEREIEQHRANRGDR
jgi:phenylacetate-coenzyme A ligase PaaK-like adenylate-forming protein